MKPRVIPFLLLDRDRRLVKTRKFGDEVYVGDPLNVLRLFNEKEVDEICIVEHRATLDGREPDVGYLRELASECFMPLGYGGGITTVDQCERLFAAGIEKIVIGASAADGRVVARVAREFGSQSVSVSVDVARHAGGWTVYTQQGTRAHSAPVIDYAQRVVDFGAGEIVLHSIDRDGMRQGYDLELIQHVAKALPVPVVALGGAGTRQHLRQALEAGASAVGSGSTFVFVGALRAVLVTYPMAEELAEVIPAAAGAAS